MDIIEGLPQGTALDIMESGSIMSFNSQLIGTNDYLDTANSEVVIITAGISRKPGMSRDELLHTNMNIVSDVIKSVVDHSPDCNIIIVTNPVDVMTYLALNVSHFPRNRILGLSGVLDGGRFITFIATELKVAVDDISVCVLGQHGENMVVIPRLSTVKGKPITEILPQDTIDRLIERTLKGGAEILALLKTSSAFYAPSAAVARMTEAIVLDKKEPLTCAACLKGEYGIKDTVIGVPLELGKNGIEHIIELELNAEEKAQLIKSADAVKQLIETAKLV